MNRAIYELRRRYPGRGGQARITEDTGVEQSVVSRLFSNPERVASRETQRRFESIGIKRHWWLEEVDSNGTEAA